MSCQTLALLVDAVKDRPVDWPSYGSPMYLQRRNQEMYRLTFIWDNNYFGDFGDIDEPEGGINVFIHDSISFEMYHLVYKGHE